MKYISKTQMILLIGDILIVLLGLYTVPALRFGVFPEIATFLEWTDLLFTFIVLSIFYLTDLYEVELIIQRARMTTRVMLATALNFLVIATVFFALNLRPLGTLSLALTITIIAIFSFLWRWTAAGWTKRIRPPMRVAIMGKNKAGQDLAKMLAGKRDFTLAGFIEDLISPGCHGIIPSPHDILSAIRRGNVQTLVVTGTGCVRELSRALLPAKLEGVTVHELPVFCELYFKKIPVEHIDDSWFVFSRITGVSQTLYNVRLKRIADIAASLFLLLVFLPLMGVISLLIKIDSPGPVIFAQQRIGLRGRPFRLYKFRTMVTGKENDRKHAGTLNDPRVTPLGKILRLTRLDELPQLWNVLKGEMSLIGPRALMEEEVKEFTREVPYFHLRHTVRPGVTGWAQVNYPHGVTKEDALRKLEYDLYYIKHLSVALDLVIFLKTLNVVLFSKGAR